MTNTSSGTEHQIAAARRWRRHVGAGRELSAFLLIAGFMVVLATALNTFGVSPRRLAAILFFLTITLSGLFWGPWLTIIAAMGGVLFIDYFLIRSPAAFSVPSLREGILLFGLFAAGQQLHYQP